jgi:hypothetical protein
VRLTSNSRHSTYKLHIRPEDEKNNRFISPINIFNDALENIRQKLETLTKILIEKSLLKDGLTRGQFK